MKALRLHQAGELKIHEEPMPEPCHSEVLIRVRAVGICGSDLHWFTEAGVGDAHLSRPLVLGHEFAGEIASGDRIGERVAVDPQVSCGVCESCLHGHPNLCTNHRFTGHNTQDGALQEFITWPEHALFSLPDTLSVADGAMLEPLGVAIHAVDLAHLKPGMSIGVFGCGPIGLLIAQVARLSGATKIIATEKLPHRIEAARSLGVEQVFHATNDGQERAAVWEAAGKRGVDVAFEVAGEDPAVESAVDAAKPGGKVILAGIPSDNRTSFNASVARRKGLTFKLVRRMKFVYPRAIELVERGLVDVRSLVSHQYPLEKYGEAFLTAERRDGMKTVITL
jgi:L-iditol 2-dehydrogenase